MYAFNLSQGIWNLVDYDRARTDILSILCRRRGLGRRGGERDDLGGSVQEQAARGAATADVDLDPNVLGERVETSPARVLRGETPSVRSSTLCCARETGRAPVTISWMVAGGTGISLAYEVLRVAQFSTLRPGTKVKSLSSETTAHCPRVSAIAAIWRSTCWIVRPLRRRSA